MKKSIIIKLSIFSIVGIAFIFYLLYYSNALANQGNTKCENITSSVFIEKDFNFSVTKEDTIIKTFSVKKNGSLYTNVSGADIILKTWDKNEVKVIAILKGTENRKKDYKIFFDANDDKVNITSKSENALFFTGWLSVKFQIYAPKEFYADLNTSGGDININNLYSDCKVRTSGGDIVIENNIGKVFAKTSGGNITIQTCKGDIDVETSGGNIDAKNIIGRIAAETSGGDIRVVLQGENKGVMLETSGGDIHLEVPKNINAELDCKTSGGDVNLNTLNNFNGKVKEHSIVGNVNGGGPLIKARTSGGDIVINLYN